MGWYLRKSFKIAPGLRLNLSTRGVGLSAGTRGARIGIGPRGAYVHIGAGGVYFRKNLSSGRRAGGGRARGGAQAPSRKPAGKPGGSHPSAAEIPAAAGVEAPAGHAPEGESRPLAYPGGEVAAGGTREAVLGCLTLLLVVGAFFYPVLWAGVAAMVVVAGVSGRQEARLRDTLRRALRALQAGAYEQCLQELDPLLERHPREADLWLVKGIALYRAGRVAEAARVLERMDEFPETLGRLAGRVGISLEIEFSPWPLRATLPSAPGVDLLQAHVLARAGRHEEALAQLDGVLALNPGFHPARFMKALVLVDRAARAGAAQKPRAGGQGAPGSTPEPVGAAGSSADAAEDYRRAIALLQEIDRDDPLYLWALAAMGQVFRDSGQPELAIEVLKQGTRFRRDPEAVKAIRYELALAYEAVGNRRRAREQLARIVAEDIGYRDAHRLLQQWTAARPGTRDEPATRKESTDAS
ncbi:MAG TPA: DUF4236 domain-containing protein [Thermaerobacter sp.]